MKGSRWQLQQPQAAWDRLLHELDPCSLASTAACCSNLRDRVQVHVSSVALLRGASAFQDSFREFLSQHSTSLVSLSQVKASSQPADHAQPDDSKQPGTVPSQPSGTLLHQLYLHQLYLQDLWEQLVRAGSCKGALQDCTCLVVLDLQDCVINILLKFARLADRPHIYMQPAVLQHVQATAQATAMTWGE